jgi:hypothetical protein
LLNPIKGTILALELAGIWPECRLDEETEATMSRLFGPMRQVGIVVRDIEKSMRHWVEVCGIGPWFYAEQLPLDEFR